MGICTKRRFVLAICVLQILFTTVRQVFDFLGYMWVPILTNFFTFIFVIFGFFGAYQYRPRYLISYCVWCLLWLGWNAFVICFYLEVGGLTKQYGDALNMGTGSASWWEVNGPGCRASFPANLTGEDVLRPIRPERVVGCVLPYEAVEVLQAGVQVALALLGGVTSIWVIKVMLEEDDSFDFVGDFSPEGSRRNISPTPHMALRPLEICRARPKAKGFNMQYFEGIRVETARVAFALLTLALPVSKSRPASLYSIEFSQERPRTPDRIPVRSANVIEDEEQDGGTHAAKPMTPRRVKRRSTSRGSTRSRHSHPTSHINPVSRLLEQQERRLVGHSNPTYQSSSIQSLDRPASSYSNYHGQRPVSLRAAAQVPTSSHPAGNTLRHSYRRHMHQAPPPYNGHNSAYNVDSETVI